MTFLIVPSLTHFVFSSTVSLHTCTPLLSHSPCGLAYFVPSPSWPPDTPCTHPVPLSYILSQADQPHFTTNLTLKSFILSTTPSSVHISVFIVPPVHCSAASQQYNTIMFCLTTIHLYIPSIVSQVFLRTDVYYLKKVAASVY